MSKLFLFFVATTLVFPLLIHFSSLKSVQEKRVGMGVGKTPPIVTKITTNLEQ